MNRCELSHLERTPIDVALARRQHEHYEQTLASCGYRIARLPPADDQPDAVFVEDILVVVDGLAIVTRPGAESRRGEIAGLGAALPATLHQAPSLRRGRSMAVTCFVWAHDCSSAALRAPMTKGFGN